MQASWGGIHKYTAEERQASATNTLQQEAHILLFDSACWNIVIAVIHATEPNQRK